jgi:hypothetical protein
LFIKTNRGVEIPLHGGMKAQLHARRTPPQNSVSVKDLVVPFSSSSSRS